MPDQAITVMDIVRLATKIRNGYYRQVGLPDRTPTVVALADGMDVALTLWEACGTGFHGLVPEAVSKLVSYFADQSFQAESVDQELAIWYRSWSEAIEQLYEVPER